jgi:predicted metalloprotease
VRVDAEHDLEPVVRDDRHHGHDQHDDGAEAGVEHPGGGGLAPAEGARADGAEPHRHGHRGRAAFLSAVFHDAEALWMREFSAAGIEYTPAQLTIFHDQVHTACGTQSASVGPFYCPADHGVYLDTRFFDALGRTVGVRLGAFARAYVVAHEVAHHVQVLLGITGRVRAADQADPAGRNARSVRLELQADCFAGIWKHATYQRGQLTASRTRCAPPP